MFCSGLATRHFLHSSLNLAGKWRQTDHRPFLGRRLSLLLHHPHWLLARGTLHRWGENPRAQLISHVRLFATPWTIAHQAPLSTGLSRQEYCSGLPFPSPGDLPNPGIKPKSTASPALEGGFFTTVLPGKPHRTHRPIRSHIHEAKSRAFIVKRILIQIPAASLQQSLSFCTWVSYT